MLKKHTFYQDEPKGKLCSSGSHIVLSLPHHLYAFLLLESDSQTHRFGPFRNFKKLQFSVKHHVKMDFSL